MSNLAAIRALVRSPWAITEDGRQEVIAAAIYALEAGPNAQPLRNARRAVTRDGVAIIPIDGPLSKSPSILSLLCGGSDYETIGHDFQVALADPEVKAIVFDVDSPGGETTGCDELAQAIFEARGQKPICAYVSGYCASAAYWLASSADQITIGKTSIVGSIGCYATLIDNTEALANAGLKKYDIVAEQSPYKVPDPASAEDRGRMRDVVTSLAAVFID